MKKNKIVQIGLGITVVLACSSSVWAGFTDGFESGLGAWTIMGKVQVVTSEAPRDSTLTNPWLPTEGTHFASLWSGSDTIVTTMGRRFDGNVGDMLQFDYYFNLNNNGSGGVYGMVSLQLPDNS